MLPAQERAAQYQLRPTSPHVETGSFNYSGAAETSNAENVIVIRHYPTLAARYLEDWTTHWQHAVAYTQAGDRN